MRGVDLSPGLALDDSVDVRIKIYYVLYLYVPERWTAGAADRTRIRPPGRTDDNKRPRGASRRDGVGNCPRRVGLASVVSYERATRRPTYVESTDDDGFKPEENPSYVFFFFFSITFFPLGGRIYCFREPTKPDSGVIHKFVFFFFRIGRRSD